MMIILLGLICSGNNKLQALPHNWIVTDEVKNLLPYIFDAVHKIDEDSAEVVVMISSKTGSMKNLKCFGHLSLLSSTQTPTLTVRVEQWEPPRKSPYFGAYDSGTAIFYRFVVAKTELNHLKFDFCDESGAFVESYRIPLNPKLK